MAALAQLTMDRSGHLTVRRRFVLAILACGGGLHAPFAAATDDPTLFSSNFDGMPLIDQDNRRFSFAALRGQVLLVNFVYTGCSTVCPVQTHELAGLQQAMSPVTRRGIRFVSVSLDPRSDTPAALKTYAQRMGADLSWWSFITGRAADLNRIAERLRLFLPHASRPNDHATSLWLVDPRGRLLQRLSGMPVDQLRLVRELTAMK